VEFVPTKRETKEVVMKFLEEKIITIFGVPTKITTDKTIDFKSMSLNEFCFKYGIVLSHSSNYYPWENELAESNNKNVMNILMIIIGENKKSWDRKTMYALWADHTTTKTSTIKNPFDLVYGLEAHLPIKIQIPTPQVAQQFVIDKEALQGRIDQLMELDETRRMAFDQMEKNQEKVKGTLDRNSRKSDFNKWDLVLLWDKRREKLGMHQKFDSLWLGPYKIEEIDRPDYFYLSMIEGRRIPLLMNGSLLKHYYQGGT
jgi:hypothetical protein